MSKQTRNNALSAVMRAAMARALDPADAHSAWAVVCAMAELRDKPPPLIGFTAEGVQYAGKDYQESGFPDVLSFKAFADRFRRLRANAR